MALGLGKVVVFAVILCEEAMPSFIFVVVPLVMIFVFPIVNALLLLLIVMIVVCRSSYNSYGCYQRCC